MRSYFKNDLFHLVSNKQETEARIAEEERKKQQQKRRQEAHRKKIEQYAKNKGITFEEVIARRQASLASKNKITDQFKNKNHDDEDDINQMMRQLKQSKRKKSHPKMDAEQSLPGVPDVASTPKQKAKSVIPIFKPQSTFTPKATGISFEDKNAWKDDPYWKIKKDAQKNWENWKAKNPTKQKFQGIDPIKQAEKLQGNQQFEQNQVQKNCDKENQINQGERSQQKSSKTKKEDQSSGKKKKNKLLSRKKKVKQQQSEKQSKQQHQVKAATAPAKTKKIKKLEQNYVRANIKNKYVQKFRGQLGRAARNKKSTKLRVKEKIKSAVKSEFIQQQNGEIYNNYVNSLSEALCLQLTIQDSDDQKLSNQGDQKSCHSQNLLPRFQIPQEITKEAMTPFLNQIFNFQSFREGQFQVIKNIFQKRSTLFVAETASGKSLTYLFSSIIMDGLSIVISPLISLLLDQLSHLPKNMPAAIISSLVNFQQRNRILNLVKKGQIKLLFITPQSLQSNDMSYHLRQFPAVNFVCIDQAHCLSELSHNFRTSYLVLQQMVFRCFRYNNEENKAVILCLTATANVETISSIEGKLKIEQTIRNKSIMNKNLFITVSREKGQEKLQAIVDYLNHPQIKRCKGTLIYCRTRYLLDKVYNYLRNSGFTLRIFHSAISQKEKVETLGLFRQNKLKIIATTNALGMGLDFENLQCIIHLNMPKSIETYVQQIGRAGRRQKRAYCHLFLDPLDFYTERNYILSDQLEFTHLKMILDVLKKRTIASLKQIQNFQKNQKKQKDDSQKQMQKQKKVEEKKEKGNQKKSLKRNVEIFQQQSQLKNQEHDQIFLQREQNDRNQKRQKQSKKQFVNLSFINLKTFTQQTFLSKQAILTILIKIQNLSHGKFLKVHPISYETVKISFFKNNKDKIIQQNALFADFVRDCKVIKGSLYVKLISKCNQLRKDPIELIGDLYELSYKDSNFFKLEFLNQVYVWEYIGQITFTDLLIKSFSQFISEENQQIAQGQQKKNNSLQKIQVHRTQGSPNQKIAQNSFNFFSQILYEINELQKVSMTKLNTFYTLGFINSSVRVQSLISRGQILTLKQQLPKENIVTEFDQYFSSELDVFYDKLTGIKSEQCFGDSQKISYLPICQITEQDVKQIDNDVRAFMKHHLLYTVKDVDDVQKSNQIIKKYVDGRIISRVFLGVNDSQSNYKIYGEHTYWMKYKDRNHEELLKAVRIGVRKYLIEEKYLNL